MLPSTRLAAVLQGPFLAKHGSLVATWTSQHFLTLPLNNLKINNTTREVLSATGGRGFVATAFTMQAFNDLPPPPYSETDIYSQAGAPPAPAGRPSVGRLSPHASLYGDDAISTSTAGDVIYTPPLTPQTSHASPLEPSAAAAAYFDSRPVLDPVTSGSSLEHVINVSADSTPEAFPFVPGFLSRDVTEQDWRTFLNFLIPDHSTRSNEAVADRKLRAEGSNTSTIGEAEAQMSAIISENGSANFSRLAVERTVEEWNAWFFGPRGVTIHLAPEPSAARMPGAWDQSFDAAAAGPPGFQPIPPQEGPPPANTRGMSFGGVRLTDDGIYIGSSLAADRSGIRVGNITADQTGIKYLGRNLLPGTYGPFQPRGRGWNSGGPFGFPGQGPPWAPHDHSRGVPRAGPFGHGGPWGPGRHARGESSDSSDSDSDSESDRESCVSLDSLPDYDDLDGQQYTVYTQALQQWLARGETMVSKQDVRQLKADLRAARSRQCNLTTAQRKECARDVKNRLRELKQVRRQHKRDQKELKRQEKQRKRAEKREHKQKKRELKRSERENRHASNAGIPAPPAPPAPPAAPPAPAVHVPPVFADPMGFMNRCGNEMSRGRGRSGGGCGPGRGFGGGPWGPSPWGSGPWSMGGRQNAPVPGAWPSAAGQDAGDARMEGYNDAARKLEKKIGLREAELSKIEIDLAMGNCNRTWGSAAKAQSKKAALEKEIEALQSSREQFRLKADEEYARKLDASENAS